MDNGIEKGHGDGIEVEHAFSHNVFVKLHKVLKAGTSYKGHYHNCDHTTLVSSGKVKVEFGAVPEAGLEAEEKEYTAPALFITRAYRRHRITALEDNTVFSCIHAIRDDDGNPITHSSYEDDDHTEFKPKKQHAGKTREMFESKGMQDTTLAYPVDPVKYNKILNRAMEEGTLEQGSQDQLV